MGRKFSIYIILAYLLMTSTAYLTANYGFDVMADAMGSGALVMWLIILAIGAVSAYFARKKAYIMTKSAALILMVLYSVIAGLGFSVLMLDGYKLYFGVSIVFVVLAFSWNYEAAKDAVKEPDRAAVICSLMAFIDVLIVIMFWVLIWTQFEYARRRYRRRTGRKS